ncbi:hypothetical protein FIBSPDRAFT_908527 [Athelia psychrophila]|uniref:Uncharacterized protein n=1 Tax=Athelia psychrophila TaxID=1759441 RepID=A0A166S2E5_9AGAM|nr:hypothetical protein FIBSPDRAFT_908527 [Fibularhizoctonia sp. CBS 109695]
MWCDNCLLLMPLRGGAIAWAVLIFVYSVAGGIFLLEWGQYLFFTYPEWSIYGGISMVTAAAAFVNAVALSNRSYIWSRACKFIWPIVLIISAIRCTIMIVMLQRGKEEILWECRNGGALWPASVAAGHANTESFPTAFCTYGFSSANTAFIISLLADIGCQIYMMFLNWRFTKRLEHYGMMKGPMNGGFYNA